MLAPANGGSCSLICNHSHYLRKSALSQGDLKLFIAGDWMSPNPTTQADARLNQGSALSYCQSSSMNIAASQRPLIIEPGRQSVYEFVLEGKTSL
ncbi:hypothetical protein XAP412_1190014 [Xanthomonas phaseoli pv. phaseoli]|uniref:Uncharacterized protein n=1 Tax=Xanthomonas campestris pv. phaseoli TaxID=317013 RepID=A0AB38DV91_XANCH|nr:hypothetical protein XAP6984_1230014 [Xanthomonas phaseoli pv. phaseoli]SON76900.1 hypothetical protein XAP412_1190014 [Xanthomonas phaseoli pv. phaseoli]SON81834.1 hypothetical protein XAP7430_1200014 [Xanthomonas phaseoli pv. phaseoli]SOO31072.1 hypothetical protein XAP6164_4990002 [Xanthomonas phaseoli pv. phaseoli]